MEPSYQGKAKSLFPAGPGKFRVVFRDDATAFNGKKKGQIVGKGAVNNQISARLFGYLESQGVKTHFLGVLAPNEMEVRAVEIVPLEVIVRFRAAGSFASRYGLEEGLVLTRPLVEYSLKSDALGDPMIAGEAAVLLGIVTEGEEAQIKSLALKVADLLKDFFTERGIDLVDFKLEFGRAGGEILLADEISPDTMRLWDLKTGERLDKDRFRRDLGRVEETYQEVLRRVGEA